MRYTVEYSDFVIGSGISYTTIIESGETDEFFSAKEWWESADDYRDIKDGHQVIIDVIFYDDDDDVIEESRAVFSE